MPISIEGNQTERLPFIATVMAAVGLANVKDPAGNDLSAKFIVVRGIHERGDTIDLPIGT